MIDGRVLSVCLSTEKGTQKQAVDSALLIREHGLQNDAHAGSWHRQVSLLEQEQIDQMRQKGLELGPGDFGENIVTQSIDLGALNIGEHLGIGSDVIMQITQRGKTCHTRCAIYHQAGDCIMPRHGLFARVKRGGTITGGDVIIPRPELNTLRYAVVTLSDTRTTPDQDSSGTTICQMLEGHGKLAARSILPDERALLEQELIRLCDVELCNLVITSGGTGLSPRDITPEATAAVIDRPIPGMSAAMMNVGLTHTPRAMLSRAICGQRGSSIIVNLSGSPKAAREQLEVLLPVLTHAFETASGVPQNCARK